MHIAFPIHNEFMYIFLNQIFLPNFRKIKFQGNVIELQGDKIDFPEMKINFREIK